MAVGGDADIPLSSEREAEQHAEQPGRDRDDAAYPDGPLQPASLAHVGDHRCSPPLRPVWPAGWLTAGPAATGSIGPAVGKTLPSGAATRASLKSSGP